MEEQDVKMDSASAAPSPTIDKNYDQDQDMNHSPSEAIPDQNGEDDNPSPSPGAESGSESRAGSSDDEDDEDDEEGGEEHERVDETGAIVIEDDDDDEDDADDTADEEQQVKNSVKIEPSPESNSIAISTLLNEAGHEQQNKPKSKSKSADKSETPLAPPPSTASAKPKSKSKVKPRSPSPVPAAAPPLQTVRLSIPLGGPDNYAVNISSLAKATGQRPPTPVQKKNNDSTDSEVEKAEKAKEEEPKKKKKKNATSEYYDVTDPFIDDSELAVDDRKFFAQTKQQGFYVSSGEVALMKDRSPKKPKSKRFANTDAGPSSQHPRASVEGSKDAPIALMDEESDTTRPPASHASENGAHKGDRKKNWLQKNRPETKSGSPAVQHGTGLSAPLTGNLAAMRKLNWQDPDPDPDPGDGESEGYGDGGEKLGMKRKRISYTTVVDNGKKRKIVDITSFHPELQAAFARLKDAIAAENWEQKGKFPPSIKPVLAEVALRAVTLDEYGEHFFNLMPTLFPYNKFTMSKLIKRTIFADHTKLLVDRQDALLIELKHQADEGFPKAKEEWEKSVAAWKQRQNRQKAPDHRGGEDSGSAVPTRHPSEDPENPNHERDGLEEDNYPTSLIGSAGPAAQAVAEAVEKAGGKDKEAQAPPKKYRLTENMKAIVWELVLLSNECCRLENEKNTLEGSVMQVSEQGLRKILYQRIVSAFPQGWISSGQISRDVSAMKKRLEKEREEEQEMDTPATAL